MGKIIHNGNTISSFNYGTGTEPTLITKTITENNTYNAVDDGADGYSSVTVSVPEPVLISKSITNNGTYNASSDSADGYSSVSVDISTLKCLTYSSGTVFNDYSLNGIHGTLVIDYGAVDLGSLTWTYNTEWATPIFCTPILSNMPSANDDMMCKGYTAEMGFWNSSGKDMYVAAGGSNINMSNSNYTDAAAFKAAMSGVYLIYKLITPTTTTI